MGKPAGSSGKRALLAAFEALLSERAVALRETRDAARAGMRVDAGHRPTNRGERAAVTSQGYLAAGLNARLEEFEGALADLSRIDGGPRHRAAAGARVEVENQDGERRTYLLLPGGQGDVLHGEEGSVTVLSMRSPIARALMGLEVGDVAELELAGRDVELELVAVD